ncbi:hypothetical protein N7468_009093 [Penicillium chermesinum]|uniref:SURP motif domain-containing protein n=1 Tax=Penicillium chermesinum TaxID=63820 RepID=A0A9W9TEY1_9EURO|nr:uncharacterized protein N7468_009093 [Penicillium chermesinum]KAJ5219889.1 hypothetical protein N7468_009093 [Penicillium chermesinum]
MASNGGTPVPEEGLKPPPGVVLPPKDIQSIIEKTAGYVARNGTVFEDRIREKERKNVKFSFLADTDAYSPYYKWRLSEIKEGRGTSVSAGRAGEAVAVMPEKPKAPPEPPKLRFSARMPNISALDLDVLRLTAFHTAGKGQQFATGLSQREAGNPQFDFLRPNHSLYSYFRAMVEEYTILLNENGDGVNPDTTEKHRREELKKNIENKYHILDRAKERNEFTKWQESQKKEKEDLEEKERREYAEIDWHDFVVAETIVFTEEDEKEELPPPMSLHDLQTASLEQRAAMSMNTLRIEEAMPTDLDTPTYYNASNQPAPGPSSVSPYPAQAQGPYQPPPMAPGFQAPPAPPMPAAPGQPPMRIRSDYVPRAQARRQQAPGPMALCPNCKQQIPVAELEQHMRIELLDPRWKEQRAKAESRSSTTNLNTSDVVNNLKRLASNRTDVFDTTASRAPALDPEEDARRKRMATGAEAPVAPGPAAVPPGHVPQTTNIEDQLRHIHQIAKK